MLELVPLVLRVVSWSPALGIEIPKKINLKKYKIMLESFHRRRSYRNDFGILSHEEIRNFTSVPQKGERFWKLDL